MPKRRAATLDGHEGDVLERAQGGGPQDHGEKVHEILFLPVEG